MSEANRKRVEKKNAKNHLLRQKQSGLWQMRLTIDRGPKFVGRRIVIGLDTHDEIEARNRRDVVLKTLKSMLKALQEAA